MIDRREIISKALHECKVELYKWAQPSIDFNAVCNLVQDKAFSNIDTDKNPLYQRHYISTENARYIVKAYEEAYHIGSNFQDHLDLIINYITSKDSVKKTYIDGHKEYVSITPISKDDKAVSLLEECGNFYNKDSELSTFEYNIYLGCSPNTNKEEVEKYWQEHGYPNFKIKDFKIDDILYSEEDFTTEDFIESLKLC